MAKRKYEPEVEKLLYCSGPNNEGDGTKETSKCPRLDNRKLKCATYRCSYCCSRTDPNKTLVNENGITEYGRKYFDMEFQLRQQKIASPIIEEPINEKETDSDNVSESVINVEPVKRKRGRPRKNQL